MSLIAISDEFHVKIPQSLFSHRLEVQADISSSETASAVTCVSEKSGNTLHDTASTRALAGSILSYKQVIVCSFIQKSSVSILGLLSFLANGFVEFKRRRDVRTNSL